jgi:hypothetical protein
MMMTYNELQRVLRKERLNSAAITAHSIRLTQERDRLREALNELTEDLAQVRGIRGETMRATLAPLGFRGGVIIKTKGHGTGLKSPPHYKPDLANPETKTVIELDGPSHKSSVRREQDSRKTVILEALGWKVVRLQYH